MEGFIEQVVKRDKTAKSLIIKIMSVILLFAIPSVFVIIAPFTNFYLALVGFFLFVGGIYVVWYVFSQQKVEYEYSVTGDVLNVAKIIDLRKRKRVCRLKHPGAECGCQETCSCAPTRLATSGGIDLTLSLPHA